MVYCRYIYSFNGVYKPIYNVPHIVVIFIDTRCLVDDHGRSYYLANKKGLKKIYGLGIHIPNSKMVPPKENAIKNQHK